MTLKFDRVLEVLEEQVHAKLHQATKCSGSRVIKSALDFRQLYRLWSRISLERIKQSTSGKRHYELHFFHVRWKQLGKLWSTNTKI